MENKTVKELKQIAKERKIKGYYKFKKEDLVRTLNATPSRNTSQRSILSWLLRRPVLAPKPVVSPRHIAQSPRRDRPVVPPRPVSNDLISLGSARLVNREMPRDDRAIIDEPFQDTTEIITPRPVVAPKPSLFSRFKKTAINAVYRGFNRVLEVIDPYVPTPVKNTVIKVKKGVGRTIKSLKDIVIAPIPTPQPVVAPIPLKIKFKMTEHSAERSVRQFSYEPSSPHQDITAFLNLVRDSAIQTMEGERNTKVRIIITCEMKSVSILTGEEVTREASFSSNSEIILAATDVITLIREMEEKVLERSINYNKLGSNCVLSKILKMDINFINYVPISGGSYIELPTELKNKKAIINIKNEDNQCFKWVVTRALNMKKKNNERMDEELIKKSEELNWGGMEFPVKLKKIDKFEKNNPTISINVFGYEDEKPYPLRISPFIDRTHCVDLLFITNKDTDHYCLIKSLSRLLSTQTSKGKRKQHYCRNCLQGYDQEEKLQNHQRYCYENAPLRIELPKEGATVQFKNYKNSMRVPYIVYADFESITKPINTCTPNSKQSYTKQYQKHVPSSFCYYIKCFDDNLYKGKPVTYIAESDEDDVAQKFIDSIERDLKKIFSKIDLIKKKVMTDEDEKNFEVAVKCHICEKDLDGDKVLDHCHLTGKYRGAAHNKCNLNYKVPNFIPIVFHNLSGYDTHLFIKKLGGKLSCIPTNEEKYISFTKKIKVRQFTDKKGKLREVWKELRFIDSFRFMGSSLKDLTDNLVKDLCHECSRLDAKTCKVDCLDRKGDKCKCKANCKECENRRSKKGDEMCKSLNSVYSGEKRDLLLRKGVYPYDWVDSIDTFSETQLPPIEAFYSKLCDEGISAEDYTHAQKVYKEFGCETFRDYHDIYNMSDVLILADVFENFRDVCHTYYRLDPAWYYTSPGLAWDAMLKLTEIQLELLIDPDMLLLFQRGIRGGISMISNRYGTANNKYMGDSYDPSKPSKFIQYLDANNLYGWAMCKPLPVRGFRWMTEDELSNWKSIPCILEVDLDYPTHLHDDHNDYPLAPERLKINNVDKLVPNLNNKENYIIHYENLKQYERLGLIITKIHRGITFEEEPFMKQYIDLNTDLRTKAKNEFEKDFFKLMNNSVFGKTMENIQKHVDVRLITTKKEALKLSRKPNYERNTIFDEKLIAVHMKRTKLFYNKPVYLGMCILDLSKTLMFQHHYDYIKPMYEDKAKLLMTDTDSLIYEIETEDFYQDIAADVERMFDTSEFDKDHPAIKDFGFKVGKNKKVIGMFKDETGGKQIEEFVGLRPKLYSYKLHEKEHKKCKGVKKSVVVKTITHEDYKNCLISKKEQLRTMNVIRSHLHDIYTEQINKVALSADDDKRIILADGMHTLAIGHCRAEMK